MQQRNVQMDLSLAEKYFHLSLKGAEHPLFSYASKDLVDRPELMKELLVEGGKLVQATGMELAVSFVGISFFGLVATKIAVLAQYNRLLDLSLDNLTIQLERHNDHAHVVLKAGEWRSTELPAGDGRAAAVHADWAEFTRRTLTPLVEAACAGGGFKPAMVWNQYGARIAYFMDFLRESAPSPAAAAPLNAEFETLCGLPPEWFNRRKNPFVFTPVYIDSPYKPDTKVMIRSACCMYYKRENGAKCYTCPILKEPERDEMKRVIQEAAAK